MSCPRPTESDIVDYIFNRKKIKALILLPAMQNKTNFISPREFVYSASITPSQLQSELVQAYIETEYKVNTGTPFTLRIGEFCEPCAKLCAQSGMTSAAFITPENPLGEKLTSRQNDKRWLAMEKDLSSRGFAFEMGVGQHPHNNWPEERSFLIWDLSVNAAIQLGSEYQQNAIVYLDDQFISSLILLR